MPVQWSDGGIPYAALDDFEDSKVLMKDWIQNDADGQDFAAKFNTAANVQRLAEVLELHGLSVSGVNLSWVFQRLRDSGQLLSTPQAAPELDVPRDRSGKPLTEAQKRWAEYIKFGNEHSSTDRKERARTDPGFAAFVRASLRQEMNQEIDGDLRPFNPTNTLLNTQPPPSQTALNDAALVSFADRWRAMSMSEIRSSRSRAINPLTAQKFIDDESRAMKLGLI